MVALAALAVFPASAFAQSTTTAGGSAEYRAALTKRLAKEYGDAKLAKQVVQGLGADRLAALVARVPAGEVATSPFLAYTPPRVADGDVDSLVVFAFGNRTGDDGDLQAGPVNEAIGKLAFRFALKHDVQVYAHAEIAALMHAAGMLDVVSIDLVTDADGTGTALSTVGVTEQVVGTAQAAGEDLGTVGVVAFSDHAMRSVLTARKAGMSGAAVPRSMTLPRGYDPASNPPWTRTRAASLLTDLVDRLTTL